MQDLAAQLGGHLTLPQLSWKYSLLGAVFGIQQAKRWQGKLVVPGGPSCGGGTGRFRVSAGTARPEPPEGEAHVGASPPCSGDRQRMILTPVGAAGGGTVPCGAVGRCL